MALGAKDVSRREKLKTVFSLGRLEHAYFPEGPDSASVFAWVVLAGLPALPFFFFAGNAVGLPAFFVFLILLMVHLGWCKV